MRFIGGYRLDCLYPTGALEFGMTEIPSIFTNLPADVTLIAVSKQQSDERLDWALQQNLRQFGENRVQEAQQHWTQRRAQYPDLVLHLIGPLQSNKTRDAVMLFDVIHSVDRPKIAHALAEEMRIQKKNIPCFIQVNTGDEPQKAGISFTDLPAFYHLCKNELGMDIVGLMCIPPFDQDPTPHFQALKKHGATLGLSKFSMGMSDDFDKAITCGATHIRVGSALFGQRSY